MRTIVVAWISIVVARAVAFAADAEPFKVPERTPSQKHNWVGFSAVDNISLAIAYAKAHGASVDDYAAFCGERFASGWKKEAGFSGLARGMLGIWENFRHEGDPPIAILAQTDATIQFKAFMNWKRHFANGPLKGTTLDEFTRWIEIVDRRIAEAHGCAWQQRVEGDFVIVTITKGAAPSAPQLSAQELLRNAIRYHDPQGKWSDFAGTVRLATNYTKGNLGEETVDLRNRERFYQWTQTIGSDVCVRGVAAGAVFRSVNGDKSPADAVIKKRRLDDDSIQRMRQHHAAHIGFVMEIAVAGLDLSGDVARTEFSGRPVYALSFAGKPGKVSHTYWEGDWTLFIDRETFALLGYRASATGTRPGITVAQSGELEIAGIRLPLAKNYSATADGAYLQTDIFTRP